MTRYLITGGAGLVGSHIADQLLADDDAEVVVVDDFSRGRRANLDAAQRTGRLQIVDGDIRDRPLTTALMRGVDVVFHQAALRVTQCATDSRLAIDVLATGTLNVVEAAAAAKVRRIVAASSASVYGMADQFPTPEHQHPYNNETIYGAAKVFGEGLLQSFRASAALNGVALRYFNVYGPRMDVYGAYTEVMVRWIERIDAGLPPVIFGDGRQTMDFVYVEDVARANVLAARLRTRSRVFNIGRGVETTLIELAETLLRVMGTALPVQYQPERAVNAVRRRVADVRLARAELGFEARIDLEDGLTRLVQWWRQQKHAQAQHG